MAFVPVRPPWVGKYESRSPDGGWAGNAAGGPLYFRGRPGFGRKGVGIPVATLRLAY